MIMLAAAWFYLLTYDGGHPIIGPLTKPDCVALQRIRARLGEPQGACIPARVQR